MSSLAVNFLGIPMASPVIGASGRVSFCSADQLMTYLGVLPGSVTPFGLVNDVGCAVTMVLERQLLEADPVNFHPLENTATTSIRREDFLRFLEAEGHPPLIAAVSNGKVAAADAGTAIADGAAIAERPL